MQAQDGAGFQQFGQGHAGAFTDAEGDGSSGAFPVPENRLHPKRPHPARESLADGPRAEDAADLAREAGAQELVRCPPRPATRAHHPLAFGDATGDGE